MKNLFFVRVELHQAIERDYDVLHQAMTDLGFVRAIVRSGVTYGLPTAMYAVSSTLGVTALKNMVKTAANGTRKNSWVIVIQSAADDWDLTPIR